MSARKIAEKSKVKPGYAKNEALTLHGSKISGQASTNSLTCGVCLKKYKPYRDSQRFCSKCHRLLFWALGEVLRDLKAGKAGGVKDIIRELSEKPV